MNGGSRLWRKRSASVWRPSLGFVAAELKYADEPAPSPLSSGYGTPDIGQPEVIDERGEEQEVLHMAVPSCCAQPSPNPSTQVRGYVARFVALA